VGNAVVVASFWSVLLKKKGINNFSEAVILARHVYFAIFLSECGLTYASNLKFHVVLSSSGT
jgi:hypothetical protein